MKKQLLYTLFLLFIGLNISHAKEKNLFFENPYSLSNFDECLPPSGLMITEIGLNSAKLSWTKATLTDTAWEILLIPQFSQTLPETVPSYNPTLENGAILISVTGTITEKVFSNLNNATNYVYYLRTVCSASIKSDWTTGQIFNTIICDQASKCTYKFMLTNTTNNNWNFGRMQVRQNGIVVAILGTGGVNNQNGIAVSLCNGVPFDLYWSEGGNLPQNIGLTIQNPFQDVIYKKLPGEGTPLTTLFSSTGNCVPPTCPKPTNLLALNSTLTSAQLNWSESGSANQWEVYVTGVGGLEPVNGTPLNTNNQFYFIANTNTNFTLTGLVPSTKYVYYVRAICGPTEISTWTILSPGTFTTTPINDSCSASISVPVNPSTLIVEKVAGTTLGGTASSEISTCSGFENDDVWFSFVAINAIHIVKLLNIEGSTTNLRFGVYQGSDCELMTQIGCSPTNANSLLLNSLSVGTSYKIRVYTNGNNLTQSATFDLAVLTPSVITNDECDTATLVSVNNNTSFTSLTYGNVCGATASQGFNSTCYGVEDDDVWFKFLATSNKHLITITPIEELASGLSFAVYSGNCANGSLVACSTTNSSTLLNENFIVGQVYYVRVWSVATIMQYIPFSISIMEVSTCQNAEAFCGSSVDDPYIFKNTVNLLSSVQIACLGSVPNPTFYTLKVSQSGPIIYNIMQNTAFNAQGTPTGNNLDVDFVAWGPFTSPESCSEIVMEDCPTCPNNTTNPNFYPLGNIVDCSYDSTFTETLSIPNAIAGQYYVVLITNFSNNPGFIKLTQTNSSFPNAGKTACGDKIQLVAFVDTNNNGVKDLTEGNFIHGSFTYQKNNTGSTNYISNPYGTQSIYDNIPTNTYDFNYEINSEYAAYYAEMPTNFNDVSIAVGSGTQTLYFPITISQNYSDIDVSITTVGAPRPGFGYSHKIVYRNLGSLPTSGTITYIKENANISISEILPAATTSTATGFTYNYSNLLPGEIRIINVKMLVATIPTVSLGDVVANSVSISSVETDINVANNTFITSQTVVGSYDPNDKNEARGSSIPIGQFTQNDYLFYTIRFQNTGNASADDVKIEDTLESQFDFASIRMVSASHNYSMERINNKLIWTFKNINLPGAFQDEFLSQGYVTFKIKLNPGFAVGDVIENTAQIYFDLNPAIITNTFQTTFGANLSVGTFNLNNLVVYPNPAKEMVTIQLKNSSETLRKITVYDLIGKQIKTVSGNSTQQSTINIGELSNGVYMIEIITDNNLKQIRKFIVN